MTKPNEHNCYKKIEWIMCINYVCELKSLIFIRFFKKNSYDGTFNDWIINQSEPQSRHQNIVPKLQYGDNQAIREIQQSGCKNDTSFKPTKTTSNKSHCSKLLNIPNVSYILFVFIFVVAFTFTKLN